MKRIISVIACVLLLSGCGAGHQNDADSGNAEPLEGEQITEGTPDNTTADPDTSLESADTIQETAAALGYVDQYHFSRRFKAIMGMPPGKYRDSIFYENR